MAEFTKTTTETITVTCPHCSCDRVAKNGKQSGQQRYRCGDCHKKFRHNGMAPGHRVPSEQIGLAIRLFYSGMSYKQIGEAMADAFDIPEPSKSTLYEWVRDYTDRATAAMANYPAHTGPEWVADEMMVDVGGEKMWNWNVMDSETRYVLASHLAKERNAKQAEIVIGKAIKAAAEPPKSIKTDKLRWELYAKLNDRRLLSLSAKVVSSIRFSLVYNSHKEKMGQEWRVMWMSQSGTLTPRIARPAGASAQRPNQRSGSR